MEFIENDEFEILTPDGWEDFDGVRIQIAERYLRIQFETFSIDCSLDHRFKRSGSFVQASSLRPGHRLSGSRVVSSTLINEPLPVYDIVNAGEKSSYITNGVISHNCEFLGSSNTLIKGEKIAKLPLAQAIAESNDGFKCYERPSKNKSYVMTVDVAEGGGGDFSAFVIFDITKNPFKIVARFKNNSVYTLAYPEVIVHYAKMYNNAFVLVETNSLGQQVADALFYDLEYENMYLSIKDDITDGFGSRAVPGAKTTKKTKQVGCNTIKTIIENDQLEVRDADIISEMSTFARRGNTFKAEDGKNDDLMMCLVNFGYLTTTTAFKNLFDVSLRLEFVKNQINSIQENELPIGFFTNGTEIDETPFNF